MTGPIILALVGLVAYLYLNANVYKPREIVKLSENIRIITSGIEKDVGEIQKMLIIQNQIQSLETLHAKKPRLERADPIMRKISQAYYDDISTYTFDFNDNSFLLKGMIASGEEAADLAATFTKVRYSIGRTKDDQAKNRQAKYDHESPVNVKPLFNNIELVEYPISTRGSEQQFDNQGNLLKGDYSIVGTFDPRIFEDHLDPAVQDFYISRNFSSSLSSGSVRLYLEVICTSIACQEAPGYSGETPAPSPEPETSPNNQTGGNNWWPDLIFLSSKTIASRAG